MFVGDQYLNHYPMANKFLVLNKQLMSPMWPRFDLLVKSGHLSHRKHCHHRRFRLILPECRYKCYPRKKCQMQQMHPLIHLTLGLMPHRQQILRVHRRRYRWIHNQCHLDLRVPSHLSCLDRQRRRHRRQPLMFQQNYRRQMHLGSIE